MERQRGPDCEPVLFLPAERKEGQGGGCGSYSCCQLELILSGLPLHPLENHQQLPP